MGTAAFRLRFLPLDATMVPWWGSVNPGGIVRLWPGHRTGDTWRAVGRGGLPFAGGTLTVFTLVNDRSGLCLTLFGPGLEPGGKFEIAPCVPGRTDQGFVAVPQAVAGRTEPAFVLRVVASPDSAVSVGNRGWRGSGLAVETSTAVPPGDGSLAWAVEAAG